MDVNELIGMTLGTCTLERIIGRGGMGAVFLAQQSRPERTVAVKVLLPSLGDDPAQQRIFLERFRREADTVAKLEHKNILPIYEYSEAVVNQQRIAYLVMPQIRGGTLRERIEEMKRSGSHFDLSVVANYMNQVADALQYAHDLGVVHRDVKPSNLLFHQDGRLLLSDFGIVRLQTMPALTSTGIFVGTVDYASPEQIGGGEIDYRADIYSLGVILYELLTGTLPFAGSNAFAIMTKHINEPIPSVRDIRPDLPPAINAVINKALAKKPEDRYRSATALATDLSRAIASQPPPGIRISGDARNSEMTVAESVIKAASAPTVSAEADKVVLRERAQIPPNQAVPVRPPGGASLPPWHQIKQEQQQVPSTPARPDPTTGQDAKTFRKSRRVVYYTTLLITLLLQFLVFALLNPTYLSQVNRVEVIAQSIRILGIFLGTGINLFILAAIGFSGVVRPRKIGGIVTFQLLNTLLAPFISGFFINNGVALPNQSVNPIIAYLLLLVSNLIALALLARVDLPQEQVETARILWRPAIIGTITGLLPLTIILIFAATTFTAQNGQTPLVNLLYALGIAFIGAPTPGSTTAIWVLGKMTFATLVRSSAVAGLLMFLVASLLVYLLSLFTNHTYISSVYTLAVLVGVLGMIGALRGMLDAWVFQRIVKR